MPQEIRDALETETSPSRTTDAGTFFPCDSFRAAARTSSTSVFHSPHSLHFPLHRGDFAPQFWQTYSIGDKLGVAWTLNNIGTTYRNKAVMEQLIFYT